MATPQKLRFEPWQLEASTEEEYLAAYKEHRNQYEGLRVAATREALFEMEDPDWVLEDMIQQHGLTILHGDPGSGKSLIAMDWAYTLSHEDLREWMGKRRKRQYRVLYLFTEGVGGLKKRTLAWERERGAEMAGTAFVMTPVALNPPEATRELAALEKFYVEADCDLLIVDTLANTMMGNENQQEDANKYLRTIRHFQEWGPVVLVHHNTKAGTDYRGSSVFKGAADTMVGVEMNEHGIIDLKITKQKDGDPKAGNMTLALREHSWENEDGYERNSVALGRVHPGPVPVTLTDAQRVLHELVKNAGGEMTSVELVAATGKDWKGLKKMIGRAPTLETFHEGGNNPAVVRVVEADDTPDI